MAADGDVLPFGQEQVRMLATPGHTAGCLGYAWRDRLFCGGLLAVDACPHQPVPAEPEALWDSLTQRVFALPDETLLCRKSGKHLLWLVVALWTGFTFVGYFTPVKLLGLEFVPLNITSWENFWVFFYGFATYGNAGFMREQVCKHMCPYARFQGAMFDKDTLIVTYDAERGDPRGARSRKADPAALNLGSCVDCNLCVQVCPTGIDIRRGLHYECIGCGACADGCNTVMARWATRAGW